MEKRSLTERDICTKFILPAIKRAGWDQMVQVREEVYFTRGRIIVRGKLVTRGKAKKADFVLYYKPNIAIALIEAKDNNHSVGHGIQQGLDYAATLDIPFVFSSNGDGFVFHDRTGRSVPIETNLGLDAFPSPADLWARYRAWKGFDTEAEQIVLQDYFDDGSGKAPRYYQVNAVNASSPPCCRARNASAPRDFRCKRTERTRLRSWRNASTASFICSMLNTLRPHPQVAASDLRIRGIVNASPRFDGISHRNLSDPLNCFAFFLSAPVRRDRWRTSQLRRARDYWIHEIKIDRYRTQFAIEHGGTGLQPDRV